MLTAAKRLGAHQAELIRYATSGDVSGDKNMVVGYAGIAILLKSCIETPSASWSDSRSSPQTRFSATSL